MQLFNLSTISGQDKLILVLSISISLYSQSYNPSLLSCTISTEKDTFLLDEPIYLEFKETNIGNIDVLTSRFHCDGPFYSEMLIGPDGKKVSRHGSIWQGLYDQPAKGYLLKPGESQYFVIPIHGYYGYPDNRPEAYQTFYLPPGEYRFKITHYTNANYIYEFGSAQLKIKAKSNIEFQNEFKRIENTINKMPITSNEIVFHIVQPDEKQDEERLLFMECMNPSWSVSKDKNQVKELMRKYFSKYETSPYFYKYDMIEKLDLFLSPPGNMLIFYNREEILEHIKDSYLSFYFTEPGDLYEDLKNDQRRYTPRIEIKKRTAAKYPNTHLAKYALTEARDLERYREQWLKDGKSE